MHTIVNQLYRFRLCLFSLSVLALILSCGKDGKIVFNVEAPQATFFSDTHIYDSTENNNDVYTEDEEGNNDNEVDNNDTQATTNGYNVKLGIDTNLNNLKYAVAPLVLKGSADGTSVANLELIGNSIPNGITIMPEISGRWTFKDENTLLFIPNGNWVADTEYTVTMNPEIFQKGLANSKQVVKFKTPEFASKVVESGLVRAVGEEKTPRFVVATEFTHAVDTATFEKAISMRLDGKDITFVVKYDDALRKAIITSAPISIKDFGQKLVFTASGFETKDSKSQTKSLLRATDTIPDYGSIFYIKSTQYSIVRDNKNVPNQVLFLEFTDSVDSNDIDKSIELYHIPKDVQIRSQNDIIKLKSSFKKLNIERANSDGLPDIIHAYQTDINLGGYLLVIVNNKFRSKSGFPLKDSYNTLQSVPSYPKELNIIQDGAILPLSGDKILTFTSRGIDNLTISIGKLVDKNRLYSVITGTYNGGLKSFNFKNSLNQFDFIDKQREVNFEYKNKSPKSANYSSVDLGKYMGGDGAGLFFVTAKESSKNYNNVSQSRIILVTDMGIISKKNEKGESSIFVVSLTNHAPIAGAKVEILGRNGIPIYAGTTSQDGRCDYPNLSKLENEKFPVAVVVSKGNDLSFLPLNIYDRDVSFSRFDIGGISNVDNAIRAFVFTDRGIYRPGEKVNIGTVVKQADWKRLDGITVIVELFDPMRDKPILKREFSLDEDGIFELDYQTATTMQTGIYSIEVYRKDDRNGKSFLGEKTFKLEEFKPDTMKVKTTIVGKVQNGWQRLDNVSAMIKIQNLFDSPAVNRRVKWIAEVRPVTFNFKQFSDYKFTNPSIRNNNNNIRLFTPKIQDSKTDANGEARANLDIASVGVGTFQVLLVGEGFEPDSGDSVTGYDTAYVSSLDYLVGYKTRSNLNYIKRNANESIEFIAIDNKLNKINLNNLKYSLKNINYVMSLVKTSNGIYTYQAVEKATVVSEGKYSLSDKGSLYNLPTKDAGKYLFELYTQDGKLVASVNFFVSGSTNLETGIEKSAELSIQLSKQEYKTGEEIEINIIAPYVGAGLITIERDKIYAYKWFKTSTTSSVQKITLPDGIEGNAYINVSFIRSPQSKDIFITPYSYGVVPFVINPDKRKIDIKLTAPDKIVPGEELKVKYRANKDSKLILFGVDEGILQVTGYRLPDPLSFFMAKRMLSVSTSQTVDLVLPSFKIIMEMLATGGGESMVANRLNPFARRTLTPSVFWSKLQSVKAGQEYEYSYNVPDHFNGTMKLMAVAVNSGSFGATELSTVVRSPIVMLVNNPFSVTVGDSFNVTVAVTNMIENSGKEDIKITAKASENIEIIGDTTKIVSVDYKGEKVASFNIKVKEGKIGASEINFIAENPKIAKQIKAVGTLSVRPATIYQTKLDIGLSDDKSFELTSGFRDMFNGYSKRLLGVSTDPVIILAGLANFVEEYPHGCSEQIVSKIIPQLFVASALEDYDYRDKVLASHKATLQELRKRSKGSNGYTLWANSRIISDEISVYIAHYLTDANSLNFPVPPDMMEQSIKYLSIFSMKEPRDLSDARLKAYATYLITRNGINATRQVNALEEYLNAKYKKEWKSDITAVFIGATYIIMKSETKGKELMNGFKPNNDKNINYGDYDSNAIRNSLYLYLTTVHNGDNVDKLNELRLNIIKSLTTAGRLNTISTARAVMALGAMVDDEPLKTTPNIMATVEDGSKDISPKSYTKATVFPPDTRKIQIKYSDIKGKQVFYFMLQAGYDKATPVAVANGVEVLREYYDAKGVKVNSFKQGDVITVKISVRLTDKKIDNINNLAVTDLLPGGIEVIREGNNLGNNFDIREDRVLIYSSLYDSSKVLNFTYNAKAVSSGEFVIPPAYAEDMYKLSVNANSGVGKLIITNAD